LHVSVVAVTLLVQAPQLPLLQRCVPAAHEPSAVVVQSCDSPASHTDVQFVPLKVPVHSQV
jgi:hypothetical protein